MAEGAAGLGQRVVAALVPRLLRLGLSVLAGLLLCVSFPPTGWWWSAVLAIALISWVLTRPETTPVGGLGYGFLFGMAFYLPLIPWISGLVGVPPWILLAVLQSLFTALFGMLGTLVVRLPGWPLALALVWSLYEWLKSNLPFGGFPWGVVAFGQTDGPLLALARIGGAPLLSFAVALLGTSLCALMIEIGTRLRRDTAPGPRVLDVIVPAVLIVAVFALTAVAAPGVRRSAIPGGDEPTVTVAAVQGNVPRLGLDFASQRRAVLDNHVAQTLTLADDVEAGRAPQPNFVIWPENSSDIDPLLNDDAAAQIEAAAQAIGVPILVGTVLARPDRTPENPTATNTVLLWDPATGPGERHDKRIVQPFGEYLPWRSFFAHLSSYAERAGHFVPGEGSAVLHPGGIPVGVATCWEVIFDQALRHSVRNGAQLLAVPTNNATFDQAMSEQQLAFARLRAVEHDRWVIVAGTTGISAAIAPDGRELVRTEFFTPAYLDLEVPLRATASPATRWAGPLQWVLIAAAIATLVATILHNSGRVWRRTEGHVGGVA
ncbi:MAG: apolipoprotein N-acyltransferase [Mycobacterium sp.]|nr:apolipoprotein N-acyltransferase [Mycobacterium sp.]